MATPTLQEVRLDLVAHLCGLADRLDLVREGAGAQMLGYEAISWRFTPVGDDPASLDLSRFSAGWGLETVYRYAFLGELTRVPIDNDEEHGNLGPIQLLVSMTSALDTLNDFYEVACSELDVTPGPLARMVKVALARQELDDEPDVGLQTLADLLGIDIRSVRNAASQPAPLGLANFRDDKGEIRVARQEALRWLRTERRSFPVTVFVGSVSSQGNPVPEVLSRNEVPAFLLERAKEYGGYIDPWFQRTARNLSWPEEKLRAFLRGQPTEICADDIRVLARVLYLDSDWLLRQMGFEVAGSTEEQPAPTTPFDREASSLEIELTEAGIRNGYFDMEMRWAEQLFPKDAFGDREGTKHGIAVELRYDGQVDTTDIRRKSAHKASPRKRFHGFFKRHQAAGGDRVRIQKIGERTYALEFKGRQG